VYVTFRTKVLERCYTDHRFGSRKSDKSIARKYVQRINIFKAMHNMDELMPAPGMNCHPLKGDRKGQFAVTLTRRVRLIFTHHAGECELVRVEEVSKHYDD